MDTTLQALAPDDLAMTRGDLTVRRGWDAEYIEDVLIELFDQVTIDGFDECPDGATVLRIPEILCLEVLLAGQRSGMFLFIGNCVHTLLLPPLRGAAAIDAARLALEWIWRNTAFDSVTSYAYSNARHVKLFARRVGLRETQTLDQGVKIHGQPVLTTLLEIRRPQ